MKMLWLKRLLNYVHFQLERNSSKRWRSKRMAPSIARQFPLESTLALPIRDVVVGVVRYHGVKGPLLVGHHSFTERRVG